MHERVIAVGLIIFSAIYLLGSIQLSVGSLAQPGPGFMPAVIATALLVATTLNAYHTFKKQQNNEAQEEGLLKPLAIGAVTLSYPFLLRPLNYLTATFLVMFILFRIFRVRTPLFSLLLSLIVTLLSFIIFSRLLGVVLPAGPLEDMILRL